MNIDREKAQAQLMDVLENLNRYKLIIAIVAIALVYGFLMWRITNLNGAQPTSDAVTAQPNPLRSAHIDKQTIGQLESLRDNSVNVKTLFDQARSNPFQ